MNSSELRKQFKQEMEKNGKGNLSSLKSAFSILAAPREDNKKKFQSKVKEILELSGLSMDKNMEVIQVQIFIQSKQITKYKKRQIELQQKQKSRK